MLKQEIVSTRTWRTGQDLIGEQVIAVESDRVAGKLLVRASVRRNAYDHQSTAKVETWSLDGWKMLLTRPIGDMPVYDRSYVATDGTWEEDMVMSLVDLIDEATMLLGVAL